MTLDDGRLRTTPEAHVQGYGKLVAAPFDLGRVLPGGRALEIVDENGAHFVLKWDDNDDSKRRRRAAIDSARSLGTEAGWPVPIFDLVEDDEWLYVRQNLMPGAEPTRLTQALAEQVIALVEATAGFGSAKAAASDWPLQLLDTLVAEPLDPTDYCSHEPLRQHGADGRRLISRIEEIGADLSDTDLSATDLGGADDLMHWDLHPGNLLVADGEISAVIDLDNAGPGPRGFDLMTFAVSSQTLPSDAGVRSELFAEVRRSISEELRLAASAHLMLRFANWAIRTDHQEAIEYWIGEGNRRLAE